MNESLEQEDDRTAFLATYDTDGFSKWEAIQELFARYIFSLVWLDSEEDTNRSLSLKQHVLAAFQSTLQDTSIDPSTKALLLNLPTESDLVRRLGDDIVDLDPRKQVMQEIARHFDEHLRSAYDELTPIVLSSTEITDTISRVNRALRNRLLEYLCSLQETSDEQKVAANLAMDHFDTAICFTDQFVAFRQISSMSGAATETRNELTLKFYQLAKSNGNAQVMNKWFQTQALADLSDTLQRVQVLTQNPDFKSNNAGHFRSLITSFTMNTRSFHTENGYKFIGNIIRQMDKRAPVLAVELANKLTKWHPKLDDTRAQWMRQELHEIKSMQPIRQSLFATVSKALPQDYHQGTVQSSIDGFVSFVQHSFGNNNVERRTNAEIIYVSGSR